MKIVNIKGQIELLSGLHIGGGDDTMKIGGVDTGVIKNINSDQPYIPGSSLKGKMRNLLEWNNRLVAYGNGKPFTSENLEKIPDPDKKNAETLLKLFGDHSSKNKFGITRISVGDCNLSKEVFDKELKYSEEKVENTINRQTGTSDGGLRNIERVPAGVKFDYDIRVKVLEEDGDGEELIQMVKDGLGLVENDYLGGSGSRGYGRVKFISE
ncbi:MAG: type III-A CRISPR-associated RAMP protein Csm3 [Campylobacterota bacterium]|nr:type III-A CRISPR-associated RAMP protein Csm3 [Campylobacterota bacterium]